MTSHDPIRAKTHIETIGLVPRFFLRLRLTAGLLVFLSTLAVYCLSINGVWATDHATSFLELDWSIWTNHTFVLGAVGSAFKPNSADDFSYNGNYYSALAPGTAILALPFAGLGFLLEGRFDVFNQVMLLTELFVAIVNAVAASLVYLVSRFFFGKRTSVFLAFVYAFATISWPFATFFFQSDVSACFDLLAAFFALRVSTGKGSALPNSILAGAAVAVGSTVDYVNAIFIPIVFLYLAFSTKGLPRLKSLAGFALIAVLGLIAILAYNYVNFGSPLKTTEQLYLNSSNVLTEFSYPLYLGVFLNLFSLYRGLFLYSIFLVIGVFGFYEALREKPWRKEGVFLLACFLAVFIPYSMWYEPDGGDSFGPRFLVAAIPFLLIPSGIILEGAERRTRLTAYGLFAVGVVINGIGALTSAISPSAAFNTSPFLDWNLPLFLSGQLDTWWVHDAGSYWEVPAVALIAIALLIPVLADKVLARRETTEPGPLVVEA